MSTAGESAVETKAIEGRVAMTLEDFLAAWRFMPQIKRSIGLVFTVVLLAPTMLWLVPLPGSTSGSFSIIQGLGALIALGAASYGIWLGRKRWARGAFETLRAQEGILFRFDDYGFTFKSPGREGRVAWNELHLSIDTGLSFLVYTGPQSLAVVPKRAFAPEDEGPLQALLRERIRPRRLASAAPIGRLVVLWLILVIAFLVIWHVLDK